MPRFRTRDGDEVTLQTTINCDGVVVYAPTYLRTLWTNAADVTYTDMDRLTEQAVLDVTVYSQEAGRFAAYTLAAGIMSTYIDTWHPAGRSAAIILAAFKEAYDQAEDQIREQAPDEGIDHVVMLDIVREHLPRLAAIAAPTAAMGWIEP
jgi:hypothetical protein